MNTVATQSPVRVDWDELTLGEASSPLSIAVMLGSEPPEVIEQDCPQDPLFLRVPTTIRLALGGDGIVGDLAGELRVVQDGAFTVSVEGSVEAGEPWGELGEAHIRERHDAGTVSWHATILEGWDGAALGIGASGIDADGGGFSMALWRGHWVIDAGSVP